MPAKPNIKSHLHGSKTLRRLTGAAANLPHRITRRNGPDMFNASWLILRVGRCHDSKATRDFRSVKGL